MKNGSILMYHMLYVNNGTIYGGIETLHGVVKMKENMLWLVGKGERGAISNHEQTNITRDL